MAKQKKEEQKSGQYQAGDALKGTVPNFDAINFRNRDVMRWTEGSTTPQKQTPVNAQGLSTFANRMKLPRYTKK